MKLKSLYRIVFYSKFYLAYTKGQKDAFYSDLNVPDGSSTK